MKRALLVLSVAVALLATSAGPAASNHSWGPYHWARTSNPFTLRLLDSMTSSWDTYLGSVSSDWSASSVLDTPVVGSDDANRARKRCRATLGAVRVCNATYGFNGWLGIAEIWLSGTHIKKARARVNDSYFSRSPYNDANAKRHVLCQEVGHTLGLDHQTAKSCMDDRNGLFDANYVSPNQHDYGQLGTIYAHLDGSSTIASSPARSGVRTSVTVRRVGDVTKITWIFRA